MDVIEIVILLVIAAILGLLCQRLLGYRLGGLFVSILLGFAGGYLGKEVAIRLELPTVVELVINGRAFPVVWAVVGCLLVTFVVGSIARRAAKQEEKK